MIAATKIMNMEQAVSQFVKRGDCLALGGFSSNRRPYAIVREIVRQEIGNLTVESGPAGGDLDLLIGVGLVDVLNISYIANPGFSMVTRRFRDAAENNKIKIEDYSLDVQTIAYHAAALGLEFVPVKNMLGSDLEKKWGISVEERENIPKIPNQKFIIQTNPFRPSETICLVPAPQIDVACIHVQKASPAGICRIEGPEFQDVDIAMAAKHTIISCEELVSDDELRASPEKNSLPDICVDAVVHTPYGAHPSQCSGYYDYDPEALKEYDLISKTQADFDDYLERTVYVDHTDYLAAVGAERLKALRVDSTRGYVVNLKRR